jgi:chromosome segregation ATPase
MNSEQDTLPNNEQIFNAIKDLGFEFQKLNGKIDDLRTEMNGKIDDLRAEMNARFEQVDLRFEQIDARFEKIDVRFEDIRLEMMSLDVRTDRVEALNHKILNVTIDNRADVKVLREEVRAWAKEVQNLERQLA